MTVPVHGQGVKSQLSIDLSISLASLASEIICFLYDASKRQNNMLAMEVDRTPFFRSALPPLPPLLSRYVCCVLGTE